jgi:hypothetical protein
MYVSRNASRIRQKEAQHARDNRAEIVRALNSGDVSRRDLLRWGIFSMTGALAMKNGLSPFAKSAYASVPTGAPRSPLFGAKKFTTDFHRLRYQKPYPLRRELDPTGGGYVAHFPDELGERPARRLSYHTDFTLDPANPAFRNPVMGRGPIEGRPPGEIFAHQRWNEYFPQAGYLMSIGPVRRRHLPARTVSLSAARQLLVLRRRPQHDGQHAAFPAQDALRRAGGEPRLQQHAGRAIPEQRFWPKRNPASLPQRS